MRIGSPMIRPLSILLVLLVHTAVRAGEPVRFEDMFVDSTLRIDYYHIADNDDEEITLDRIYCQGQWAGNPHGLIDPFDNGRYRVRVIDVASNRVLYTYASSSYCSEYQTTDPAGRGVRRTFHESALIPLPRRQCVFVIEKRDRPNVFTAVFTQVIDPHDYHIIKEQPSVKDIIVPVVKNGRPRDCVDLVILGEGYTAGEEGKFRKDLTRFSETLLGFEPYKEYRSRFNITGILRPSPESGVDQPRQGIYRNTTFDASFNALDSDRYLLTEDNKDMRDVAAAAPYDALVVMVNSPRYGGGGLANVFTIFTTDNTRSEDVFLHEFAHGFAGLADEYYSAEVSYNNFFPPGVEPTEPNLTALLDPEHLKWRQFVSPGVSIPTEWGQSTFDSLKALQGTLGKQRDAAVAELRNAGATDAAIQDTLASWQKKIHLVNEQARDFIVHHPLRGKIGAFQGGGYLSKGLYRPTVNSLMHTFTPEDKTYYKVNEDAISKVIRHFTE